MSLRLTFLLVLAAGLTYQYPLTHSIPGYGSGSSDETFDKDLRTAIMERLMTGKAVKVEVDTDHRLTYSQDKECSTCGGLLGSESTTESTTSEDTVEPTTPGATSAPPTNHVAMCLLANGVPSAGCSYTESGSTNPLTCPLECQNSGESTIMIR